jgi:hypothetical protein
MTSQQGRMPSGSRWSYSQIFSPVRAFTAYTRE